MDDDWLSFVAEERRRLAPAMSTVLQQHSTVLEEKPQVGRGRRGRGGQRPMLTLFGGVDQRDQGGDAGTVLPNQSEPHGVNVCRG
jgi:hypothetical protein